MKHQTLFDDDFGAADSFAGEAADAARLEGHDAVFVGVDGVVSAQLSAFASAFGRTDLADNDLADFDGLASIQFYAKALAGAIASIFGGSASFNV